MTEMCFGALSNGIDIANVMLKIAFELSWKLIIIGPD